jgi:hypothetical protein
VSLNNPKKKCIDRFKRQTELESSEGEINFPCQGL